LFTVRRSFGFRPTLRSDAIAQRIAHPHARENFV
jgi:hypothetical protein